MYSEELVAYRLDKAMGLDLHYCKKIRVFPCPASQTSCSRLGNLKNLLSNLGWPKSFAWQNLDLSQKILRSDKEKVAVQSSP
jgi:hypothetical protein